MGLREDKKLAIDICNNRIGFIPFRRIYVSSNEQLDAVFRGFDFKDKEKEIYLIFGKESTGIPKEILKNHLDRCIRIPTTENVRALNLSNCVAVATYEVLRQQDYPSLKRTEPHKGEDWLLEDELVNKK